jgi:cyclic beta-1,2-glucan synthetase
MQYKTFKRLFQQFTSVQSEETFESTLHSQNFQFLFKSLSSLVPLSPSLMLTKDDMYEHGIATASSDTVHSKPTKSSKPLRSQFLENTKLLFQSNRYLVESSKNKEFLPLGADWLLDNYHVIEQNIVEAKKYFPKGFDKTLPKLKDGEFKDYPRVYRIAHEVINHSDFSLSTELLDAFLRGYQTKSILSIGELWAIPIMIKFSLLDNLRRIILTLIDDKISKERIDIIIQETLEESGDTTLSGIDTSTPVSTTQQANRSTPAKPRSSLLQRATATDILIKLIEKLKANPFLVDKEPSHLLRRLREISTKSPLALQWMEDKLRDLSKDPETLIHEEQQQQASNQVSIGNIVTSLRHVNSINWRDWFEAISHTESILRQDPGQVYRLGDFETRDYYRHHLELLAKYSGKKEEVVAEKLIEYARGKQNVHIGSLLIGKEREEFEEYIEVRNPLFMQYSRKLKQSPLNSFFIFVICASLTIISASAYHLRLFHEPFPLMLLTFVLLAILASDIAINLFQWFTTHTLPPTKLPKLSLEEGGIPREMRTLVAVHGIFDDKETLEKAIEGLEIRFLANDEPELFYALLADLYDSQVEITEKDNQLIEYAALRCNQLNQKYAQSEHPRFSILFRKRKWNEKQQTFMGWERKRGKIHELNSLILGHDNTSFLIDQLTKDLFKSIKYVITLDGDSQLPYGAAKKLIGTIAHPLNRAVFTDNPVNTDLPRKVIAGYGIIQPRVTVALTSSQTSRFAKIFSGQAGLDPYTNTISDFYQDLFDEASYVGKAIYDVSIFETALRDRIPENTLLSHDLFEGIFARVGLASDIEIFDEFPSRYNAYTKRQHRWVRGDWQLLRWLSKTVTDSKGALLKNDISKLGQWKLFDNLRRSIVSPVLFLIIVLSWFILPGSPLFWCALIVLTLAFPIYTNLATILIVPPLGLSLGIYFRGIGHDLSKHTKQMLLSLCFLPHQSYLMLHAICITLSRIFLTKKQLLEWETAYHSEKHSGTSVMSHVRIMFPALLITLLLLFIVLTSSSVSLTHSIPMLFFWGAAPLIAARISKKTKDTSRVLFKTDQEYLRDIAYDTWRYFKDHLKEEYHFLIPDNVQLLPNHVIAERSSPTNISLSMLSCICGYELGFEPLPSVVERLSNIFQTLEKLEKHHGHLLNWYDIKSLAPLNPRYISFVDNGNLIGHLFVVKTSIAAYRAQSIISSSFYEHLKRNLKKFSHQLSSQTVTIDLQHLEKNKEYLEGLIGTLNILSSTNISLGAFAEHIAQFVKYYNELSIHVTSSLKQNVPECYEYRELEKYTLWYESYRKICSFIEPEMHERYQHIVPIQRAIEELLLKKFSYEHIAKGVTLLKEFIENLSREELNVDQRVKLQFLESNLMKSLQEVSKLTEYYDHVAKECDHFIVNTDFSYLFDNSRYLFPVGYNVDTARKDTGYYDLLASEARLGSFVAIAKGDVSVKHWFSLGRGLADTKGGKALLSWSGTMFEYLMPLVVMKDFGPTLLSESYRAVVYAQRYYGDKKGVPWGISESAYSGVDYHSTYQYRAFGVPGLGLKRGLENDLVISPYSTMLALLIDPKKALLNIKALEDEEARGEYGFFEAIDYTKERLTSEVNKHIVHSFFAHHQGMSLTAITNLLMDGIIQERFHEDPVIKSCELLLQERFPTRIPLSEPLQTSASHIDKQDVKDITPRGRIFNSPHTVLPVSHLLSNGNFTTMIDNAGSGFNLFERDIQVTRWREDPLTNQYGTYIYIKDLENNALWSCTYQPTHVEPDEYEVIFNSDKVEYRLKQNKIITVMEVTVAQEENVEIRRISFTNISNKRKSLYVTSYGEACLNTQRADTAHPAFSKMFIESEYDDENETIYIQRRPRSKKENPLYLFHTLLLSTCWEKTQFDTSRYTFIGRAKDLSSPLAMQELRLASTKGLVLDPVFSLRSKIEIDPFESETITFITGVAHGEEDVKRISKLYREFHQVQRAFEMSWSKSSVEIRNEKFTPKHANYYQLIGNAILFQNPEMRCTPDLLEKNRLTQSALWRFGISGDIPILLLKVSDVSHLQLVSELLLCHTYLRARGIQFDLVVLNENPGGYFQYLNEEIENMVRSCPASGLVDKKGGVFLRTVHQLSQEEKILIHTVARIVLDGIDGTLESILKDITSNTYLPKPPAPLQIPLSKRDSNPVITLMDSEKEFATRYGAFTHQGKAYAMEISEGNVPPLPWSNVIANKDFGFLITESGAGYTWSGNSRENRLTPWSNDFVLDPPNEVLYIRDTDTGVYWSPTPKPVQRKEVFHVRHGFGATNFSATIENITSRLSLTTGTEEKIKWYCLNLYNNDKTPRSLELFFYVDLVLGVSRDESARYIITSFDKTTQTLQAWNHYNNEFGGQVVYIGSNLQIQSYTADRAEFIGRNRSVKAPLFLDALLTPKLANFITSKKDTSLLSKKIGAGFEQCGLLKVSVTIEPQEDKEVLFFLGEEKNADVLKGRATKLKNVQNLYSKEIKSTKDFWQDFTSTIEVETPQKSFNYLANGWLLYQTLACRIHGRSAFYQSGGAFGFRDQLQDVLSLLPIAPHLAKEQILLHASRQFLEGDVQHWWHPPTGRGVRTKISDDYLWLPYVVSKYIKTTGDISILHEEAPFLDAPPLGEHHEAYIIPRVSNEKGSILEHCLRALRYSTPRGEHGLPLIGCGDWNDGMNEVGIDGKGESVWLAWFISTVEEEFADIIEETDPDYANTLRRNSEQLVQAIEDTSWDGKWYRRAYFDDGTPLGSILNDECQIDSISQSWSVLNGKGDALRRHECINSALTRLVDKEHKIAKLLYPPFNKTKLEPGYIKGYLAGIRENGGQYTHAGAWLVIALTKLGMGSSAFQLFELMNPINHTATTYGVEKYKGEPYVMCGDVYSVEPHTGRAGWSWYTGSAGWLYQAAIHHIIGITIFPRYFTINPCVPHIWKDFSITYRRNGTVYTVKISNAKSVEQGVEAMFVRGQICEDKKVYFTDNAGSVEVKVVMG